MPDRRHGRPTAHLAGHLKHMLIGGAVILGVLVAFGVDLGRALTFAMLLACPLMMGWMMMRGHGHGHGHGADDQADRGVPAHDRALVDDTPDTLPGVRLPADDRFR